MVIVLILAFGGQNPRCVPFYDPQATETLAVDDGIPTGIAGVPLPGGIELVKLAVPSWGILDMLLFYPGRILGFETPILHWIVFNDNGPGGMPGNPLGTGTETSLSYDDWYAVDVSSFYMLVNPGHVYVGWMNDTSLNPLLWYQNWYDSAPDGYNYTFSIIDTAWIADTLTPGDYMVRAILQTYDVQEGARSAAPVSVFPNPGKGEVNFVLADGQPGHVSIHDCAGRLVTTEDFVGRTSLRLGRGIYFYGVESSGASFQGRLVVR